jgi:hypothetical protein
MDVACRAPSVLGGQDGRPRWWRTAAGGGEHGWGHFTLVCGWATVALGVSRKPNRAHRGGHRMCPVAVGE